MEWQDGTWIEIEADTFNVRWQSIQSGDARMQAMNVDSLVAPFVLAIVVNIAWRYFRPVYGQPIWFLGITSGSAVGVFAALLVGGSTLADNPYWTYVGVPLIAAALTTRLQGLVVTWTTQNKHKK